MLSNLPKHKQALLLLFCLALFSSCATRYKDALFTSKTDGVRDTIKTVYIVNDQQQKDHYYRIKPADLLGIRNLQNVEFGAQGTASSSGSISVPASFYVESDGNVMLPVIGKVLVEGLTRREATVKIQDLYAKALLKDPIIELSVINLKVTLLGEFKGQGNYLLEQDNTTLIDILGKSGGFTEKADPKSLKIIRGDRNNPELIYVNLKDINSLASPKLILKNNDLVYIEPRSSSSEKLQTVMVYIQPVLLLLNTYVIFKNLR